MRKSEMYIDFAGDKLEVVDEVSGECQSVEVLERATQIDNIVLLYLREVASEKKYPPLAFRSWSAM